MIAEKLGLTYNPTWPDPRIDPTRDHTVSFSVHVKLSYRIHVEIKYEHCRCVLALSWSRVQHHADHSSALKYHIIP